MPVQFNVVCFEGPDPYSRAGGIASRITGLVGALAEAGFETHLWFIGDPDLPAVERRGCLTLHRWCQWISRYHSGGVYDGEEGKRFDLASSLPPMLLEETLVEHLTQANGHAVVLAEEWQTSDAVLHLDWLLRERGFRQRVTLLWNANNDFGFHRIDWRRLSAAATITTVSRYMRQRMWPLGVDPLVIPNGLSVEALQRPRRDIVAEFRRLTRDRTVLAKVARWDPDKRWTLAIDTMVELKRQGWRPLLLARGGVEKHGEEVLGRAAALGLRIVDHQSDDSGPVALLASLDRQRAADVINIRSPLSAEACRVLFRGAGAVVANSGHEPFGLVGLEAMAAGGLACTGSTGEDYAVAGWNALVLQTCDPLEFVRHFGRLQVNPAEARAIRQRGVLTAKQYVWHEVLRRNLLPHLQPVGMAAS